MRLAAAALLSIILAFPPFAGAQDAEQISRAWYLQARAGAFAPRDASVYDNAGLDLEVTLGRMLTTRVALEAGVGGFAASSGPLHFEDGPGLTFWTGRSSYLITPITASLRGTFKAGRAVLSILAGAGVYFSNFETKFDEPQPTSGGGTIDRIGGHDQWPGFHVGGGAALRLSPRLALGIDLRYVFTKAEFNDAEPSGVVRTVPEPGRHSIHGLRSSLAVTYDL